jgi:hypothetical protein
VFFTRAEEVPIVNPALVASQSKKKLWTGLGVGLGIAALAAAGVVGVILLKKKRPVSSDLGDELAAPEETTEMHSFDDVSDNCEFLNPDATTENAEAFFEDQEDPDDENGFGLI